MPPKRELHPESVWNSAALLTAFKDAGVKQSHAWRLWNHLIRHPSAEWRDVPDLPKAAIAVLESGFVKLTSRVVDCSRSADGETTKLLVELQDGARVEAVVMHYDTTQRFEDALEEHEEVGEDGGSADDSRGAGHGHGVCEGQEGGQEAPLYQVPGGAAVLTTAMAAASLSHPQPPPQQQQQQPFEATEVSCCSGNRCESEIAQAEGSAGCCRDPGTQDGWGQQGTAGGADPGCSAVRGGHGTVHWPQQASAHVSVAPSVATSVAGGGDARVLGGRRATLCVSSQVGCQMGCTFCATGTMGLKGHLGEGEIVEQLVHACAVARVRNIVFMGMGEPLHNYEAVVGAVRAMTHPQLFGLARRHVTLSTVGVIPRIKTLGTDLPGISLALSLHAPNQDLRCSIVPSAKAYKLDKLMEAVRGYEEASGQRVFMEYVMLAGVNDGPEQAHELGALLQKHNATLNLIPWNPVHAAASAADAAARGVGPAPMSFSAPAPRAVAQFQAIVRDQYGVPTTVRQEKGQDISGACGQLVIQAQQAQAAKDATSIAKAGMGPGNGRGNDGRVRDIEELAVR